MALQTKDPSTAVISSVGAALSGGTTSSTKPVITGTADAGNIVVIYDGIRPLGSVVVAANGTWSFTPTADIKAGAHSFAAIAHDTAGNFGASSAVVGVTVNGPPVAPVITSIVDAVGAVTGPIPNGGVTDDARPTFNGTGIPGYTIYVFTGGRGVGDTVVKADGTWSIQVKSNLPAGAPATPAVPVLTDDSGNVIPAGSTTTDGHPHISGTGTAGDIITVYDGATVIGSVKIGSDSKWTFTPATDLSKATHAINVTETNSAGTRR